MFSFRPAKHKDIPSLALVMKSCGLYKDKDDDWIYNRIETLMSEKIVLVAVKTYLFKHSPVVGYYIITTLKSNLNRALPYLSDHDKPLHEDYAYSAGIGTDPALRGQGIAARMKNFTETYLKRKGFEGMYVDIFINNHGSMKLQQKAGFHEICRYKNKNLRPEPPHINVVFMKKFY